MSTSLKILGVDEIRKMLSQLDKALRLKILRSALRKTAKPILDDAESNVWNHQVSGRLYRSLGITSVNDKNGVPEITIGARTGGKFKGNYAHLLESGTKERSYKTKTGKTKSTGKVQGVKFWERTLDKNQSEIQQELEGNIARAMEQEINRIYKKSLK